MTRPSESDSGESGAPAPAKPSPVVSGIEPTMAAWQTGKPSTDPVKTGGVGLDGGTMAPVLVGGRYEILGLLGAGGMGSVYRARDTELDEVVALKMLHGELGTDPGMLARFRQEAKLARRVTHRNVARTFDIGEHSGEKFLTMELIEGESLAGLLARRGKLPPREGVSILREVCAAMSAAHAAGVVHRDLKPDNVLLGRDGRVVVTDFGIAHALAHGLVKGMTKTVGAVVGTPAYMAPEQVEGSADIDGRADIYSLGAMAYEVLTGERAWKGESPFTVAAARLVAPAPDPRAVAPELPPALSDVVLKCMAKSRADRFASAVDVNMALEASLAAELSPRPATPPRAPGPASASIGALASSASGASPSVSVSVSVSAAAATAAATAATAATAAASPALGSESRSFDRTVAVLPFHNAGPAEDAYLADGLTDDLIDVLSMTPGLKVRPRGAVAHLRGQERDPRDVGRELGVQVVVQGSVRKSPVGVRANARLIGVEDGFQLWAKRFDRPASDALLMNDEAAQAIAEALTVHAIAKPRVAPKDADAVDLYLRANHEFAKFWLPDVARAVELYERALERAPGDPTILAGCARARVRLAFFGGPDAARVLGLASQTAERAVAAAPDNGEAWAALGAARFMEGDPPAAVRAARTALQKAPGLAHARELLGRLLLEAGALDDAYLLLSSASALDPSVLAPRWELARLHALRGEWDGVDALLDLPAEGPAIVSQFLHRARFSVWRGKAHPALGHPPPMGPELGMFAFPKSVIEMIETREISDEYRERLQEAAAHANEKSRRRTLFYQLNAELLAYTFEVDGALDFIQSAIDSGLIDVGWMDLCPVLEPVRKDARFAPLRATVEGRAKKVLAAKADG